MRNFKNRTRCDINEQSRRSYRGLSSFQNPDSFKLAQPHHTVRTLSSFIIILVRLHKQCWLNKITYHFRSTMSICQSLIVMISGANCMQKRLVLVAFQCKKVINPPFDKVLCENITVYMFAHLEVLFAGWLVYKIACIDQPAARVVWVQLSDGRCSYSLPTSLDTHITAWFLPITAEFRVARYFWLLYYFVHPLYT